MTAAVGPLRFGSFLRERSCSPIFRVGTFDTVIMVLVRLGEWKVTELRAR